MPYSLEETVGKDAMGDDCGRKERWLIFFWMAWSFRWHVHGPSESDRRLKWTWRFLFSEALRHQLTAVGRCTIVKRWFFVIVTEATLFNDSSGSYYWPVSPWDSSNSQCSLLQTIIVLEFRILTHQLRRLWWFSRPDQVVKLVAEYLYEDIAPAALPVLSVCCCPLFVSYSYLVLNTRWVTI